MTATKNTILHDWHLGQGANMALFGNYHMPLWYQSGTKAEHLSVIEKAGIFDTSHMACVSVSGEGARKVLQKCLSKDLESALGKEKPLVTGRCVYGIFLLEKGGVLDDAIVYQLAEKSFMVVVNASMGAPVASHLQAHAAPGVTVTDLTDRVGKMDIQGPAAARVLSRLLAQPEKVFDVMPYFSFQGGFAGQPQDGEVRLKDGTSLLLSRTGYTGEFGFELFMAVEQLPAVWQSVLAAGEPEGLLACGLAARDSLRAGAVLPLSHQDIGDWPFLNNPWQFALPWNDEGTGFTKDFIGSQALLQSHGSRYTLPFAGFDPRKIAAGADTFVTDLDGEKIGTILTCTTDMALGRKGGDIIGWADCQPEDKAGLKGLSCGFVLLEKKYEPGEQVILSDGKRKIKVEIRSDIRPARSARRPIRTMV